MLVHSTNINSSVGSDESARRPDKLLNIISYILEKFKTFEKICF